MTLIDDGTYIRNAYRVPAWRNGRVIVDGDAGTITGFDGCYLLVTFDPASDFDQPVVGRCHPTWKVAYLNTGAGSM